MDIEPRYAVKLFFPNPTFTQIYFEAIANAFDAEASEINIHISSDGTIKPSHLEITIADNGIGITDERFERFSKVKEPCDKYHKGLGRLVYLQYFSNIKISSFYDNKNRTFIFSNSFKGTSDVKTDENANLRGTTLVFDGFTGDRLKSYDDINPNSLKEKILEHFMPYFYSRKKTGREFCINIVLDLTNNNNEQKKLFADNVSISESDIPFLEEKIIHDISLHAYSNITISYAINECDDDGRQITAYCVDGRTIPVKLLPSRAIPHNYSAIFLFESELFTGKSDSSRQRIIIQESVQESLLIKLLKREISVLLNENIPVIQKKNEETRQQFETKYPHLLGLFEEDTVGIIDKDEAIENAQRRFFSEQKKVLECDFLDDKSYEKSLEVSSRTLTEYILYRDLIIKRFSSFTEDDKETDIHNLIVPRYKQFHEENLIDGIYNNNAWLLDDKFMSFRTILSEARMKEVISAITLNEETIEDNGRPDISMIFSADPEKAEKVEVVVIEIKPRKVDDKENPYAAIQLIKRARKIVDHCPNIQRVWYFAIIEIDDSFAEILQDTRWIPLFSKDKVFYQDFQIKKDGVTIPTPTCLLSYDAVIKDAAARNHTFLEILKNDIKNAQKLN